MEMFINQPKRALSKGKKEPLDLGIADFPTTFKYHHYAPFLMQVGVATTQLCPFFQAT